ncbi:MAG: glycosyltransferase family 2 protein [Planctomycetota bacterium]
MKLSVIIPVYNEVKTIQPIIEKVKKVTLNKEIIIVDDCSTDGTKEILEKIKNNELKIIFQPRNMGKGTAIKTALAHVTGNIVIIQDADLEYDPQDYHSLIKPIINGKYDIVYGSRILKKENKFSDIRFYWGGKFVTLIANLLYQTNLTDEATGYKVFKSSVLKNLNLQCKKFEFCPEVTAKISKKGLKIKELPISYYPRKVHQGKKLKAWDGLMAIWTLIKYKYKNL